MKFIRKSPVLETFLNTKHGWRPGTLLKRDSGKGAFQYIYCKLFKIPILKIICEQLLVKVKPKLFKVCQIIQRVAKIYKETFFKAVVSERATFSNIAQTRLLLCNFAEEVHFWAITFWTFVIYVPLMSYVLAVIVFVTYQYCSSVTPVWQKQAICEKIFWSFSFVS